MSTAADRQRQSFARRHHIEGLSAPTLHAVIEGRPGYSIEAAKRFVAFQARIDRDLLQHPVITNNQFTAWFSQGKQTLEQVRAFIVQFSVFSNQFLVAQLQKMINADSLEGMRASKEILANELGVVFRHESQRNRNVTDKDREGDPDLVSNEGTVDGGIFKFRAAHFEWLLQIASRLDLEFQELGRRCHGTDSTLFFCDELVRLYGSEDYQISQSASYAVENWAAAGFWKELIRGFDRFNQRTGKRLPLAFFTWHDRLESQHALHTQEELEALYLSVDLDEDRFIRYGKEMLDGVAAFWNGLDDQRRELAKIRSA